MTGPWLNCPSCGKHVLFQVSGDVCSCPVCGLVLDYSHVSPEAGSKFAEGTLSVLKVFAIVLLIGVGIVVVGIGVLYVGCALAFKGM